MNFLNRFGKFVSAFTLMLIFFYQSVHAQVQTAKPGVSMIANSGGFYEYLPEGYSATGSTTYPLLIMLHGQGELGDGSATKLSMVLRNGVPYLINAGKFPTSFTSNGQTFKFIVITPQFKQWPTAADIGGIISYCQSHYKIDASRVYLTGFSMGGGTLWNAISDPTVAPKIAAAVVFAGATYPSQAKANVIADNNIGVWAIHNDRDGTVSPTYTLNWINYIRTRKPSAPVKKSIFSSTSHNCWVAVYPDGYKEDGINIYQFMLMFKKGSTVPVLPTNKPPVANAGVSKSVTLPTSSVTLSGSGTDLDNGISSYAWSKVSGPAAIISAVTKASTAITGLTSGSYVFRLTVKDKELAIASSDITVSVTGSGSTTTPSTPPTTTPTTSPTTFYASAGADQTIMLPVSSVTVTGKATDIGGTVSKYRWSKISGPSQFTFKDSTVASTVISNLTSGSYTFRLTVTDKSGVSTSDVMVVTVNGSSSSSSTGTVSSPKPTSFYASAGSDIGIVLPVDSASLSGKANDVGGTVTKYQWSKISGPTQYKFTDSTKAATHVKGLVAGTYTFRLTVYDASGVYTSDAIIVKVAATGTAAAVATATSTSTAQVTQSSLTVNPDPIVDKFTLSVNNDQSGTMKVQFINADGVSVKTYLLQKPAAGLIQSYLSAGTIPAGKYQVTVEVGTYSASTAVEKQ